MSNGDDATKKNKNGGKMNSKNGSVEKNEDVRTQEEIKKYLEKKTSLKRLSNKARIELLEQGTITLKSFLDTMDIGLKRYWRKILNLLKIKRIIRNTDFAEKLTEKRPAPYKTLNSARGILGKFEEWNALTRLKRPGDKHHVYFCNLPEFYSAKELQSLSPEFHKVEILKAFGDGWEDAENLSKKVDINETFLEYLLDAYADEGLLDKKTREKMEYKFSVEYTYYRLNRAVKESGDITAESIQALGIIRANNMLEQTLEEEAAQKKFSSIKALVQITREDLGHKTILPKDIEIKGDSAKFVFLGELSLGHQFADIQLIDFFLEKLEKFHPDLVITSDFVQGDFKGIQVDRVRTLTRVAQLNKVSVQYKGAGVVLDNLARISKQKTMHLLSDDDWQIAVSRALIAMERYFGLRRSGLSAKYPEEIKRLSGEDYRRFMKFQWNVIAPYQYRIGRTLYKEDEVFNLIGEKRDEYLLITFIMLFEKKGIEIPKKWKLVVDMEALHGDKKKSKLSVTPDPIILRLPERFGHKIIQVVHNMGFSSVTQYLNSLAIPESVSRHLQARGMETPYLLMDFHQERFFGTMIGKTLESKTPTFIFNLPGCKNTILDATYNIKSFNSFNILTDKVRRQNAFRKEPSTPAITGFELFPDGRIKFKLWTHRIERLLEANKDKPEERELMPIFQDLQIGSIQMRPEWVIKGHDYALYERGATIADYNGDIIQGINYKQTYSENRPKKLVSTRSQQAFIKATLEPFYPSPKIKWIRMRIGNHEWNTFGTAEAGQNNLVFFADSMMSYFKGLGRQDISVVCDSRIRLKNSANPGGATVNWPYTAETIVGGFKYAIQHKWAFSEGNGAINTMVQWVNRMAGSVGDVDLLIAGHKHMFATGLVGEKLFLQLPGLIDQSGYEMAGGYMPQSLLTLIEFSNKEGITVELIPIEFLEKYKCQSPFYKEIDAKGLLDRPKEGTSEYRFGYDSPYIHQLENEIDVNYREV
jgi:hypothetical protein